ncbi:MAG TPA: exodeoxyribonuclease VII large subunit [Candidatus Limnocylindrales bacterium]|nr:exodeoxyribonuclease VII large subunit [Candidatus Limnocylindrales bacterium]
MSIALSDTEEEAPLSVTELVGLIGGTLERDFSHLLVLGEITSFSKASSGHCYFTLADDRSCIECVMWRGDVFRLAFRPEVGDEIVCRGRMGVFGRQGKMQLYITAMKPVGAGAAQKAFEQLRARLHAEGIFDAATKRPLPFLPRTIGLVTSRRGAAVHDILTTLQRRFPGVHVVLSAATVQGATAPRQIVAALSRLAEYGRCDVVIVGRGGGASEDLAAFNDEAVVRAVKAFPVPVVSAVGHEIDVSLCDLAADLRAATPTAAAEAVVPVRADLELDVSTAEHRLRACMRRKLEGLRHRVDAVGGRLRHPAVRIAQVRQSADRLAARMERAMRSNHAQAAAGLAELTAALAHAASDRVDAASHRTRALAAALERAMRSRSGDESRRLTELGSKLDALSPLAVLARGYSLASHADGTLVRGAGEITVGETLQLRFHRGRAAAQVLSREDDKDGDESQ